ncbi:MAG: UvrD-helicase domain-containing protein [Thermostichus sp. DG02_5_bins_236]
MHFQPNGALDDSLPGVAAEAVVWNALRQGLGSDAGYLFHQVNLYDRQGTLKAKPDILLIHFELGVWVFECKSCNLHNIEAINGSEWRMREWHKEIEMPLAQADKQMFEIKNGLQQNLETRPLQARISWQHRVALPWIRRQEWQERFGDPPFMGALLFAEDLENPEQLRQRLYAVEQIPQTPLSEPEWEQILQQLGLVLRDPGESQPIYNYDPQTVIRRVQERILKLDEEQRKIASQYPEGPQRIRGSAGTGKTVVMTRRAARIHDQHPDWDIAVVFFTRSLYEPIRRQISETCQSKYEIEPNWEKIQVMHAWGSQAQSGFYRQLATRCGLAPKSVDRVEKELGRKVSPGEAFEYICGLLEQEATEIPQLFDAILIDEGQDLPPVFYRLAYQALRDPKRLYWAYDEAQGIGSLVVPGAAELFGRDEEGKPKVTLAGRSMVLRQCYRTPQMMLMAAHALNMGLLRQGGPLQGVTQKEQWEDLGYQVLEGDFRTVGSPITLTRTSPHPVDQEDFQPTVDPQSLLRLRMFPSDEQEQNWIANQIAQDIHHWNFQPDDLLVTAISGYKELDYWKDLKLKLKQKGVNAIIAGEDTDSDTFRLPNHVTLSGIFRAKGNEAWKVYVCRFQNIAQPSRTRGEDELRKRNEAFVALTRTKLWCVVTGVSPADTPIPTFQELQQAKAQYPKLVFPAFNQGSLRRVHQVETEPDNP